MNVLSTLPRILIVDDLLGRRLPSGPNAERATFCGAYLLRDVTGDEAGSSGQEIRSPLAEAVFCRGQRPLCALEGNTVENNIEDVVQAVRGGLDERHTCWSLVLLDLSFKTGAVLPNASPPGTASGRMEDSDPSRYFGLQILEQLRRSFPDLPVLVLSGNPREDVSLKLAEHGAVGFIDKGVPSPAEALAKAIQKHGLIQDDSPETEEKRIIGRSRALLRALRTARLAALSRKNILIRGENGTGKELLAAYIRGKTPSGRRRRPFEVVNSSRLTPQSYQIELFGYKKGAFTDATEDRIGALRKVEGGDLFLDEVAELHHAVQAGLLRLLESREYSPYGAFEETIALKDVRFLSATNADLPVFVGRGDFREDLYYRLRELGEELYLPPLRERSSDIPLLSEWFVRRFERELAARSREITPEALDLMCRCEWPGNIRELKNCLYAAVSRFDDSDYLVPAHLPEYLIVAAGRARPNAVAETQSTPTTRESDARALAEYLKAALEAFLHRDRTLDERPD